MLSNLHQHVHRWSRQGVTSVRALSVLAWGRSAEGQTGVEGSLVVTRPTCVLELHDVPLACLVASKLSSAAVTSAGDVLTWGDGRAGKLGHGSTQSMHSPLRVESLVGRADVAGVALGEHHMLLLDRDGGVWACGENKEGQCGLGTPLEVIAAQHRRSFYESMRPTAAARSASHSHHTHHRSHDTGVEHSGSPRAGEGAGDAFSRHLRALLQEHSPGPRPSANPSSLRTTSRTSRHAADGATGSASMAGWGAVSSGRSRSASWQQHGGGGGSTSHDGMRMALLPGFGGMDMEGLTSSAGMQPGHHATPMRLGRDQHPLSEMWAPSAAPGAMRVVGSSGLVGEVVTGLAASRHFSVAVSAAGEVWTWGACYNGSLGSHSSWATSAQRVTGVLAATLADHGGAVRVVAGGTFCAALTVEGKVVVWGKVPSGDASSGPVTSMASLLNPSVSSAAAVGLSDTSGSGTPSHGASGSSGGRVLAGVVPDLPRITHLAAGTQHLVMSDGERVWVVGRTLDAAGEEAVVTPWHMPKEVLTVPGGIASLAAGSHSSGVVGTGGELYVWGRLLDQHHAESLLKRYGVLGVGGPRRAHTAHLTDMMLPEDVRWGWAGFGGHAPRLVDGLPGRVRGVALGGWHAMALLD